MIPFEGVPGTAQPAIQEGKYAAGSSGPAPGSRRPSRSTTAISGSSRRSVAPARSPICSAGSGSAGLAFLIWGVVHLAYLVGWGNRYEAVARWAWTILARNRREREISIVSLVSDETAIRELEEMPAGARPPPSVSPTPRR